MIIHNSNMVKKKKKWSVVFILHLTTVSQEYLFRILQIDVLASSLAKTIIKLNDVKQVLPVQASKCANNCPRRNKNCLS